MEESPPLEKILPLLKKPQSSKKLVHVLTALRKHVNAVNHPQAIEMIRKCNSLKQLIGCTQFDSNLRVVDLALSILGNCCTNGSVVRHVVNDLNILQNMLRVVDKQKKDSIQGRVFRIFGNICDAIEPIRLIQKEPKLVVVTINFLKEYAKSSSNEEVIYSGPTISMALRFIRKLLVMRTYSILAEEHNFIPTLGMVLIKCTSQWILNKNDDVLVNDLLKILQIITTTSFKYNNFIPELKNTESGDALQSLGDIILLQPERITKIILRLAKMSKNLSDLPMEAIITNLISQVEQQGNTAIRSQSDLLLCVSNLMDHLGFHDMIRNADIVTKLIKLLKTYNTCDDWSIQCCIYISQSLNKCRYNEVLMQSQLNANIIPIIVDKLAFLSGKSTEKISFQEHEKKEYKAMFYKRLKLRNVLVDRCFDFDECMNHIPRRIGRCASPSSCSDVSSCGPFSPAATLTGDDSDSDNYSPLCSETECDDEYKDEHEEIQDLIPSDTDENRPAFTQDQMELRSKLRSELCCLLRLYCAIKPLPQHMGDTKVIIILMNLMLDSFVNKEMNDREYAIIKSISLSHNFLIPFMATDVLSQVYEVMETKHIDCCSDCIVLQIKAKEVISNFLITGNSDSIKGDIAYILLAKEDNDLKERIAFSIPYVIRNKVTLTKLLLDCGGLELLIQLFKDESDREKQTKSIKSICTLAAINLKIKNPVQSQSSPRKSPRFATHLKIGKYVPPDECDNEVTFRLDDGTIVKADRDQLKDKSDYFGAMFSGSFLESKTSEIMLKDVSSKSLECLLELLKTEWLLSYTILSCTIDMDYNLDTILEVIILSDRFLLNDWNYMLIHHVEQQISLRTVPTIYKWSIESGTNTLRIESIAFALVNDNSYCDKLDLFRRLFNLGYTHELVEDVGKLIRQFL